MKLFRTLLPSGVLAVLLVAGSLPLMASAVAAAPLAQPLALKNIDMGVVEEAQYRRGWRRGGRWIGPGIGLGFVGPRYYDDGYYAYGAAPGYYPRSGYRRCAGTSATISGYPSWLCSNRRETDW